MTQLRAGADPFQLAHVGALHAGTAAARALLLATAAAIDAEPADGHRTAVWTVRSAVERSCREVVELAPRVAGVAALTRSPLGQRLADLGIYIRQHHGERDLAALGEAVLDGNPDPAPERPGDGARGHLARRTGRTRSRLTPWPRWTCRSVGCWWSRRTRTTRRSAPAASCMRHTPPVPRCAWSSPPTGRRPSRRPVRTERAALARTRRAELDRALDALGLDDIEVLRLGLPDSGLEGVEQELVVALRPLAADAEVCLAPWCDDPHPDHAAAGRALLAAAPAGAHRFGYPIWTWPWGDPRDPHLPWSTRVRASAWTRLPAGPSAGPSAATPPS